MVLPDSHRITRVPWYLGTFQKRKNFAYRTITFYGLAFLLVPLALSFVTSWYIGSYTRNAPLPRIYNAYQLCVCTVWAIPLSLATTKGISIDLLSCRYLDVSVPCVRYVWLCIHHTFLEVYSREFSHWGISGS